jgi:hypothetical protein
MRECKREEGRKDESMSENGVGRMRERLCKRE